MFLLLPPPPMTILTCFWHDLCTRSTWLTPLQRSRAKSSFLVMQARVKTRERKRMTVMRTNGPISTRELSTVCGEAGSEGCEPEAFALG